MSTDTQWPRWEVFEQEQPGAPYRNAGSVHAPDGELALENARDVFVRRPHCNGLWVVPAQFIFTRTAQELAAIANPVFPTSHVSEPEPYFVFQKQSQRTTETFVTQVGEVQARSFEEALELALTMYGGQAAFVWWIFPARVVIKSLEMDIVPMFSPAEDKPYRHPQFYKVVTQLRELKSSKT